MEAEGEVMDLKNISFIDGNPKNITVEMDIKEAIWIAKTSGKQRGMSLHNSIYSCLVGDVFNRYWEDGVGGADIENGSIIIPPINYDEKD